MRPSDFLSLNRLSGQDTEEQSINQRIFDPRQAPPIDQIRLEFRLALVEPQPQFGFFPQTCSISEGY